MTIAKVWELGRSGAGTRAAAALRHRGRSTRPPPATGWRCSATPRTFAEIARVGPDPPPGARGRRRCSATPARSAIVAVATPRRCRSTRRSSSSGAARSASGSAAGGDRRQRGRARSADSRRARAVGRTLPAPVRPRAAGRRERGAGCRPALTRALRSRRERRQSASRAAAARGVRARSSRLAVRSRETRRWRLPDEVERLAAAPRGAPAALALASRSRAGRAGGRRARQSRRTRTDRSRCTLRAELALELAAGGGADLLDHPPAAADQDALLRLGLDPQRARARRSGRRAVARVLDDRPRPRAGPPGTCAAAPARAPARRAAPRSRWSELVLGGKKNGPSGSSAAQVLEQRRDALPRARADREDVVADAELGDLRRAARGSAAGVSRSTLLTAMTTGADAAGERLRR